MGTDVLSGQGRAIILKTGNDTFFGDIASNVSEKRGETTSFDRGVKNVSKVLIRFMIIMVPIVFLLNGLTKGDWGGTFFAIAVAVGLTPEMLPMIITSNLAKGAIKMSKKKVIVERTQCYSKSRGNGYSLYR